jgi:hypothetical protein
LECVQATEASKNEIVKCIPLLEDIMILFKILIQF